YFSPLRSAARAGQPKSVRWLLDRGADAKEPGPLHEAAYRGHLDIVDLLLARGADANAVLPRGHDLFDLAFEQNRAVLRYFVDGGLKDSDWSRLTGGTPLQAAIAGGRLDVARRLAEKGADVNAKLPA